MIPGSPRRWKSLLITAVLIALARPMLGVAVTGVVRSDTGAPLASMSVAAYTTAGILQAAASTDQFGRYGLDVPPGTYRLLAFDNSGVFATTFAGNADSFDTTPTLTLQNTPAQVDFTLVRGGVISGQATTNGAPIRDVIVTAYNLSGSRRGFTTVDANGRYSLVLPPGSYKLVAYHSAGLYAPQFHAGKLTFTDADPVTVVAGATQPVNFALAAAASVLGTVRDTSGRPVKDVTVIAYTLNGVETASGRTDVNGQYSVSLPAGTFKLVAADFTGTYAAAFTGGANSFATAEPITLRAGEFRAGVSFVVMRGARITGKVIDRATRLPLANVTVEAYNPDGTSRTRERTREDGSFVLVAPAGSYQVVAYDESGNYAMEFFAQQITFNASTIIATSDSAETTVNFELVKAGRITGRVLDRGLPVPGVRVAAYTVEGDEVANTLSDQAGRYAFSLPPGSYKLLAFDSLLRFVTAYAEGARSFGSTPVRTVTAGATDTLDFNVQRGVRVSGTVKDNRGQLVSGVEISALDVNGIRLVTTTSTADGKYALTVLPGTYSFAVTDPFRRFGSVFYRNATIQRLGEPVTVTDGSQPVLDFILQPISRHRAAGR